MALEPTIDDIREYHWSRTGALLTTLLHAFERESARRPDLALKATANVRNPAGTVVPDGFISVERRIDPHTTWDITIGFVPVRSLEIGKRHENSWEDAIDYDVRVGFPPFRMPAYAIWRGRDRFGRDRTEPVELGPVVITKTGVQWRERHWQAIDDEAADAISGGMLRATLLHASPQAAADADPAHRWVRVGEAPRAQKGGQGAVWKVRDRNDPDGPLYALKEMRYRKARTSGAYRRFLQEIAVLNALKHPNIVEIVDSHVPDNDEGGVPFYVMPYAERTLDRERGLTVERVLDIGVQLASALAAAHEQGIVHRDVKPANVLIREDGTVQIADFGICYLADTEERVTHTDGETVGSHDFVAPELRGGRLDDVDGRVDIYSLGKTLYAALADGRVFPLERYNDARYDLRKEGTTPALEHFYGLLPLMIATERDQRFSTMAVCRDALQRALHAVRNFLPYREGMYGGGMTPRETALRLAEALSEENDLRRRDRTREAVEDTVASVEALLEPVARTSAEERTEVAREAAEHLLAVLLELVAYDEQRQFTRLVNEMYAAFTQEHRLRAQDVEGSVYQAAVAIACFGAAALAWRMERWAHLRVLLDQYRSEPYGPTFLDLQEGYAEATWLWIVDSLKRSNVLQAIDHKLQSKLEQLLGQAAGLLAVGYALHIAPPRRHDLIVHGTLDLPGLYGPGHWVNELAERLLADPELERGTASLFGLDVATFKDECAALTPILAKSFIERRQRGGRGESLYQGAPWCRWTGATVPQTGLGRAP